MPEQEYKLIFSKNLKHYLDLNNKSQQDLVKDLGLSASTVSNWYTGLKLPRMSKVEMLANYFGINKSDLLEDKITNIKQNINSLSKHERFLLEKYNSLDTEDKSKVIDYTNLLSSQDKYKKDINVVSINKKEIWEEAGKEHLMPIACHDDNLTDKEKVIVNERINEILKNLNKH